MLSKKHLNVITSLVFIKRFSRSWVSVFCCCLIVFSLLPSHASALTSIGTSNTNLVKNGLVGHWTFDGKNMTNATATDSSGNGNHGALVNMTQASSKTIGKIGQALTFNGSTRSINLGTSTALNITNDISISAWIKPTSYGGGSRGRIIDNAGASPTTGYRFDIDNANVTAGLGFGINVSGTLNADYITSTANVVSLNKWQMVTVTFNDGTDTVRFYINGVLQGTKTLDTSILSSNVPVIIGAKNGAGDAHFDGAIDDLRVYNRAISATEIQSLYKAGGGVITSVSAAANKASNGSGLVGHWTFDGKNMTNATATDSSGNGNHGALVNMTQASSKTIGKIGQALNFKSSNITRVQVPNASSIRFDAGSSATFSAWVYLSGSTNQGGNYQSIFTKGGVSDGAYQVYIAATTRYLNFYSDNGGIVSSGVAVPLNNWSYLTVVATGGVIYFYINGVLVASQSGNFKTEAGTAPLYISDWAHNNALFGSIDDARIYNRALSTTEIQALYKAGGGSITATNVTSNNRTGINSGLVAHWTFDGKNMTNATAPDVSGNGNNGTLTNMTQASAKAIGKLGQGLKFDGVNDYITIPYSATLNPSNITISYWVKESAIPATSDTIISGRHSSGNISYFSDMRGASNQNPTFGTYVGGANHFVTAQTSLVVGRWYHVVGTFDGSTYIIYINGVLDNTLPDSTPLYSGISQPLSIGNLANGGTQERFFKGTIDDVRIYNRALSASEIKSLYKLGAQ